MTEQPAQQQGQRRQAGLEKDGKRHDHLAAGTVVLRFLERFVLDGRLLSRGLAAIVVKMAPDSSRSSSKGAQERREPT